MTARTFQIYRYEPDRDAKPRMQTLTVEVDGAERMLLDALMKLKAVDVCRKGLNPTRAIGKIKETMIRRAV